MQAGMTANSFQRVAVLGAGGMGTALGLLLSKGVCRVTLWARDRSRAAEVDQQRQNLRHLPGVTLPEDLRVTADPAEATEGADLLVAAVPSAYLRETMAGMAATVPQGVPVLSVVKGIEFGTFARPSQVLVETLGERPVAVLGGPAHAEELARGMPASVVVAGPDNDLNRAVQARLTCGRLRVYTNGDALGVELASALKNVLGLAAGICDGLEFGDNAKAAMLTRGLAEIARFTVHLGGRPETLFGLAGVGDVLTTCYSHFGRNHRVGEMIGQGLRPEILLDNLPFVAEGVFTTRSVDALARRDGVSMPITREVHSVLFEGKDPREAVVDLMLRPPRGEWL
jgi:glycerol-3-phosphate dehydrogenase (NAD(P)+)